MYPILLDLAPITIFSLWVLVGLGFFVTLILINNLVKHRSVKINFIADNSLIIFFSGLIFSRIFFVIRNFQDFFYVLDLNNFFRIFYIWDKGLSPWGGVIGVFIALYFIAKKEKANFLMWSDIIGLSILFGSIFVHLGSFLDGRNYGTPTELPWGVTIQTSKYAIPIHPTPIYAAIYTAIIAIFMYLLFNKDFFKKPGNSILSIIISYSFFRFLEEFIRGDDPLIIFGISEVFIYTAIVFFAACFLLFKNNKEYFKK